jgi:hypothetical protein
MTQQGPTQFIAFETRPSDPLRKLVTARAATGRYFLGKKKPVLIARQHV